MTRLPKAVLRRRRAHMLATAALDYLALALPSPARELVDVGVPGWTAYAAYLTARAGHALKTLGARHRP